MATMTRQPETGRIREATTSPAQQAGDAGAKLIRGGGEIAHRATETTGETVRRGEVASARIAEEGAARTAHLAEALEHRTAIATREVAQATTESLQGGLAELWRTMVPGGTGGLRELQGAMLGFYAEAMRTNLRIAQDVLKTLDPSGLLQGQQKAAHQMLDAMLAAQTAMFGAARQAGEAAATPPR